MARTTLSSQKTIQEMEALGQTMFLNGIIEGLPIAKNVANIINKAVAFGNDEAGRSDFFYSEYKGSYNDLFSDAVRTTVESMMSGTPMSKVAHEVTLMGMAYGFGVAKHNQLYGAVEDRIEFAVIEQKKNGRVSDETTEAVFAEIVKLKSNEMAIKYARQFMERKLVMSVKDAPSFKVFSSRYSTILVG